LPTTAGGRIPWLSERAMTSARQSRLLFAVCFFLCSVVMMYGQASFFEQVIGGSDNGINCETFSTTKLAISCTGNWVGASAEGYEIAKAQNGFGTMRGYGFSAVIIAEDGGNGSAAAQVVEGVEDY
jgi:hypothetical protein